MMRGVAIVLGICVIGAVAYCVYYYRIELGLVRSSGPPPVQSAVPSEPETKAAPIAWQTIERPDDGFRVDMPARATETQAPAYTARGAVEQVEMLETSGCSGTFAVSWAENPPVERANSQDADQTLDMALNGALARTQTALISQSRGTYAGYQARDFAARGDGGVMDARLILAGKRLFMLVASFPAQSAQHDAEVSRFFNSFSVTAPSRAN
jgi:hypothetical protein